MIFGFFKTTFRILSIISHSLSLFNDRVIHKCLRLSGKYGYSNGSSFISNNSVILLSLLLLLLKSSFSRWGKSLNLPTILWILHSLRLSSTKDLGKSDKSKIGIFPSSSLSYSRSNNVFNLVYLVKFKCAKLKSSGRSLQLKSSPSIFGGRSIGVFNSLNLLYLNDNLNKLDGSCGKTDNLLPANDNCLKFGGNLNDESISWISSYSILNVVTLSGTWKLEPFNLSIRTPSTSK
ncbi:predicted protein [Candida tropicalis MYA-3404]|uniref:Uncharacterized protein n=1 Tax=Candida tropicalis (strain ATCC MYA-3404 / T1) TaxID=294747 RepID=C5M9X1_CANTT|nr:predicted protein [Candida tropicalis MYA-3404]EER33464.1 predicted protein [Candida tropicalis MYA-3404]KAG4407301.1 hypothetical protein JTP64_002836 [Candida tropicalis]